MKFLNKMDKIIIIILGISILIIIAIFDYFFIGRKLIGEVPLKPIHLITFYFGRSFAELFVFMLGILFGGYVICSG